MKLFGVLAILNAAAFYKSLFSLEPTVESNIATNEIKADNRLVHIFFSYSKRACLKQKKQTVLFY